MAGGIDPAAWGLTPGYHDVGGTWHDAPAATVERYLHAMGADAAGPPPPTSWIVGPDERVAPGGPLELELEDGTTVRADDEVPHDLPFGYHRLRLLGDGREVRLVRSPGRCPLPDRRRWGWAVQLPTTRSARSWGIGDLGDLHHLGDWAAGLGGGFLLVSPLHAPRAGKPQEASPYSPSSRRWHNPLLLRVEDVPGFAEADDDVRALAAQGRALLDRGHVDRDAVLDVKDAALRALWRSFPGDPAFDAFRVEQGDDLAGFATFTAFEQVHGRGTRPPHPSSRALAGFRGDHADEVAYQTWLQWLLDGQVAAAGGPCPLLVDLAVGFDPDGADAWQFQDLLVTDARVGAPPDEFNQQGQDWGLPPFDPWRLRASGYEPFVRTVRRCLRHAGGLRVDHVVGLFRQWWVPLADGPTEGVYVRFPAQDLLRLLALEAHRAGAIVVGEDLGTVEDEARRALGDAGVLSYRVLWFEDGDPSTWPRRALASVTTHDLPTVAGVWSGADVDDQRAAGVTPDVDQAEGLRRRLTEDAHVEPSAPVTAAVEGAHRRLATAASDLVCASLEDALGVELRPNLPATTSDQRPNWSIPLPLLLDDLVADERPRRIAAILAEGRQPPVQRG